MEYTGGTGGEWCKAGGGKRKCGGEKRELLGCTLFWMLDFNVNVGLDGVDGFGIDIWSIAVDVGCLKDICLRLDEQNVKTN